MLFSKDHGFLKSLVGKVIISFLVACLASLLAWYTSKQALDQMLSMVNRISQPSERLDLVDNLSSDIVNLAHFQNLNPSDARNEHIEYYEKSKKLITTLDSLQVLLGQDQQQLDRIMNMKKLIIERDKVFSSYIGIRSQMINNQELSEQVQNISEIISSNQPNTDSTLKTITKETRTTTLYQPEQRPKDTSEETEKRRFLGIFKGKKKNRSEEDEIARVPIIKKEEITVVIDSLVNVSSDSSIHKVNEVVQTIEATQRKQTGTYVNREKQLAESARAMTVQLSEIVDELKLDIKEQVIKDNQEARELVNKKIEQLMWLLMGLIVVLFVICYLTVIEIFDKDSIRQELTEAKQDAELYGQAKQRFLANMSHEIRTPLQAIIGYTDLISENQKPERVIVESLKGASDHLLHLVNQVLDYSRIVSNSYTILQEPFELDGVLRDVLHIVSGNAQRKGIFLDYENTADLHKQRLVGDSFRLKQILLNLFSNAIRFTPEYGRVSLHVRIKGQDQEGRLLVKFEVKDTGIGMSTEELQRIFNEFEQANQDTINTYGGTGLGLSIVKELVTLQEGYITVDSTPNTGSIFAFVLPYTTTAMEEDNIELASTKEKVSESLTGSFQGLVWVIDDDRFIRDWCSLVLKKLGIRHQVFESGVAAVNHPIPTDLQIVFTDMRMPGMSGEEVCRFIKEQSSNQIKVYVITAQALPEEHQMLKSIGFDDIIMKPFKADDISAIIAKFDSTSMLSKEKHTDFSTMEEMTFGDTELLRSILEQFKEDTTEDVVQLQQSIHENDFLETEEKVADILHKLAGRVGQIGALELASNLRGAEVMLRSTPDLLQPQRVLALTERVKLLLIEVDDYLLYSI